MTPEGEDVRVPQSPVPPLVGSLPGLPRLFAEEEVSAEVPCPDDDFVGLFLLDGDCLGVRGTRPASRRELAELILRYRDEQAAQRARRKRPSRASALSSAC